MAGFFTYEAREQFTQEETVKTVGVTRPYLKELRDWYRENAGKTISITRPAPPEIRNWSTTVPCTDWEQKDWCDGNHKEG